MDFVIDVVPSGTGNIIWVSFLDTKDMVCIILNGILMKKGGHTVVAYCYHNDYPLCSYEQFLDSVRNDVRSFCTHTLTRIIKKLRPDLMEKDSFQRIHEHEHLPEMEKVVMEFIDQVQK